MARLKEHQKLFVVQQLARFSTPSDVAAAVKVQFGVEVSKQAVQNYDPGTHAGRKLSRRWRAVFEKERAAYIADTSRCGVAHRSYRLAKLQQLLDAAKSPVLVLSILEQSQHEAEGAELEERLRLLEERLP